MRTQAERELKMQLAQKQEGMEMYAQLEKL